MGLLSWLGLKRGDDYPNLDALLTELRKALPDDESVFLRYVAIVVVLIGKVAWADGTVSREEEQSLRELLSHIDRLSPSAIEAICAALRGEAPRVTETELELCYRELKSLCDAKERVAILRLLAKLAVVDGDACTAEHAELEAIAAELGISLADLTSLEAEVASQAAKDEAAAVESARARAEGRDAPVDSARRQGGDTPVDSARDRPKGQGDPGSGA